MPTAIYYILGALMSCLDYTLCPSQACYHEGACLLSLDCSLPQPHSNYCNTFGRLHGRQVRKGEAQQHLDLSDKEAPDPEARQAILVISFLKKKTQIYQNKNKLDPEGGARPLRFDQGLIHKLI